MASLGGIIGTVLGWLGYQMGQRTDVADAGGSLHAKVKDIRDNKLQSAIGISSDNRASNTVMGWLNTSIKSWQRVNFTPTSLPYSVSINDVNPSKCLVFLNGAGIARCGGGDGDTYYYSIEYYVSNFTSTLLTVNISANVSLHNYGTLSAIIVEFY